MKLINNIFKFVFVFAFLFISFTVDAQFKRTVVFNDGSNGEVTKGPCDFSYFLGFNSPSEILPCEDIRLGITLEEAEPPITLYFEKTYDFNQVITADGKGREYVHGFSFEELYDVIYETFCPSTLDEITLTYNLYCPGEEVNTYTPVDPCDPEYELFYSWVDGCNLSYSETFTNCCVTPPNAAISNDILPIDGTEGEDEEDEEEEGNDEGFGYSTGTQTETTLVDSKEELGNPSIQMKARFEKTNSLIEFTNRIDFIEIKNLSIGIINYQIVNISGQVIYQGNLMDNRASRKIDISELSNGLYILTYGNNDKIESQKFVR